LASKTDLDEQMKRFERRLPGRMASFIAWVRKPSSRWVRIPSATVLLAGGVVGFLPIAGFWMIPLGLVLIAQDVPPLRSPMARLLAWIDRRWPARK
jgi:hypothetical protein